MNILFSGDGNIASGVLIAALSLCRTVNRPVHIYLLTATVTHGSTCRQALSQDFADFLDKQMQQYNPRHSVQRVDITDQFASNKPEANMNTRFTPCCMLRLYADRVEQLPDRILYLDNDVICRSDPSEFYYQDLTDFSLAGTLDYYGSWFFYTKPPMRDYLNSGVLLLNLKRIRQNGLFEKCREKCKNEEMFMPDQSAINKLCRDKKICPRRFNEQRRLHRDTVFQHFTTSFRFFPWFHTVSVKPWNTEGMHKILRLHEYDALLEEYQRLKNMYEEKETVFL